MMKQQPASLEEIGRSIYANKPIFYTLLIGGGIGLYLAYRHFATGSTPAPVVPSSMPASNTPSGNTYANTYTTVTTTGAYEPVSPAPPSTTTPAPQPGPIVAPPAPQGSLPPKPGGIISQHGSLWTYGNPPKPLVPLFPPGTVFSGGDQGRAWYQEPGQNKQLLTANGYGKFAS